jgi:cyanophycinase-like exopeptidase
VTNTESEGPRGTRGALVLAGSGEFLPVMVPVDEVVLKHTPGNPPKVAILPTAAGLEDVTSWITMGVAHFQALGCEAYGVPALDRAGVENSEHVKALDRADFIYLSGGSPGYLVETLRGSAAWCTIVASWARGNTLAGSSAGAMAFGEWTLVRPIGASRGMPSHWSAGLGLMPGIGVIPHYDRFGPERTSARVAEAPPGLIVLGIDEDTVMLRANQESAQVLGRGTVTVWRDGQPTTFSSGEIIPPDLVRLP